MLLQPEPRRRWRAVGRDIYRTVGGYVTGNLLISLIAGTLTTIVLLITNVPYAVALGLIVAILDLIPLAGATIAAIIVGSVAFLHSIPAGIIVVFSSSSTSSSRTTSSSPSSMGGQSSFPRSPCSSQC
jgi:predicted PurR-regulated permease PerM